MRVAGEGPSCGRLHVMFGGCHLLAMASALWEKVKYLAAGMDCLGLGGKVGLEKAWGVLELGGSG